MLIYDDKCDEHSTTAFIFIRSVKIMNILHVLFQGSSAVCQGQRCHCTRDRHQVMNFMIIFKYPCAVSLTVLACCCPHRGKEFIINHLRMEDVSCYWERLLREFSRLLTYKPVRRNNYNRIVNRPSKSEL